MINAQTGFLHFHFESKDGSHDTIPLRENFAYCYSLFRSHEKDKMQSAIAMLEKLLAFYVSEKGFPYYLHQYPNVYRTDKNILIAYTLYAIEKHYRAILNAELKERVKAVLAELIAVIKEARLYPVKEYQRDLLLSSFEGKKLPSLPKGDISAQDWGEILILSQHLDVSFEIPWHDTFNRYLGFEKGSSALLEKIIGGESDQPLALFASLLHQTPNYTLTKESPSWQTVSQDTFHLSYTLPDMAPIFRLITQEGEITLEADALGVDLVEGEKTLEIFAQLKEFDEEEKDVYPIKLVMDDCYELLVNDERSGVIKMGDTLSIASPTCKFELDVHTGSGSWMGHLTKGDRSQKKGNEVGNQCDWLVLFRPIQCEMGTKLHMTFRFDKLRTVEGTSHHMDAVVDVEHNTCDC